MNDPLAAQLAGLDPVFLGSISGVRGDVDGPEITPSLPGDHPAWQRDVLSMSARARALVSTLRPLVIKVLNFWDHRVNEIALGGRSFGIDPSGSYRLR